MDDLEFRRRCLADPHDTAEDFRAKCGEDPDHAQFVAAQIRFDQAIRRVLLGIEPPAGLAQRILARQGLGARPQGREIRRYMAMAASLILIVGLSWFVSRAPADLPHTVLAHIYGELDHLNGDGAYPRDRLAAVLSEAGPELHGSLGTVRYAGTCHIRRHDGAHLVVQGQHGAVTVLLMPGEDIAHRRAVGDQRFHGVIVPTPNGSMAIVGERQEAIEYYEQRVRSALSWPA